MACYNTEEIDKLITNIKLSGKTIGVIPTMGNLHAGHLNLAEKIRNKVDIVIVTIFVNPNQFAAHEDFGSYPRTLEKDLESLKALCDIVFIPQITDIYPNKATLMFDIPHLTKCLCGLARPHFFNGVMQVLYRIFNIIKPNVAIFGEKDYQQLLVIKEFVRQLNLNIEIIGQPTVRELNGLAMSSRNGYFNNQQKERLGTLYQTLNSLCSAVHVLNSAHEIEHEVQKAKQKLITFGFDNIDYLEFRHSDNLQLFNIIDDITQYRVFFAGKFAGVRLIDNLPVSI